MKKSIFLFALMGLVAEANATGTNTGVTCNGNSSCSDTYNTTNNTTNQGGVGYGGASSATGGSASSSATGGSSTAYGGTSSAYNGGNTSVNANTVKNESTNVQGQSQSQAIKNSGNSSSSSNNTGNNGNSTVTVEGDTYEAKRIPVNTAYAPSIAPTSPCVLGASAGISLPGVSASFGVPKTDSDCKFLEEIRAVSLVLGDQVTAETMMCLNNERYRKARLTSGRACPVEQE